MMSLKPWSMYIYIPLPTRKYQRCPLRTVNDGSDTTLLNEKKRNILDGQTMLALQQPRLPLVERLTSELRFVLHLDLILRDDKCEDRDALRLGESAPNAAAWAPAERQKCVARIVAKEARRLEGVRFVPIVRCK